MEYAIGALAVALSLLVVAHSRMSYKGMLRSIKDPSHAIILRPNLGFSVTIILGSYMLLSFAGLSYGTPSTTGSHDISLAVFMLVFFVILFPLGWLSALVWTCLEPGVAHVARGFGFRHTDVYASQVRYWEGRTWGGTWARIVYELDDPYLRLIRFCDAKNKGLFAVYGPRNRDAVLDWVKAYCPQILVSLAYKKKPKQ